MEKTFLIFRFYNRFYHFESKLGPRETNVASLQRVPLRQGRHYRGSQLERKFWTLDFSRKFPLRERESKLELTEKFQPCGCVCLSLSVHVCVWV